MNIGDSLTLKTKEQRLACPVHGQAFIGNEPYSAVLENFVGEAEATCSICGHSFGRQRVVQVKTNRGMEFAPLHDLEVVHEA